MNLPSNITNRPLGWVVAGFLLIVVMVLSYSIGEEQPQALPTMAIDEDLAPLQSGSLEFEPQYTDLIVPIALTTEDFVSGTAP